MDEPFMDVPDDELEEEQDAHPNARTNDDDDDEAAADGEVQPTLTVSAVWKGGTLGLAFMDGTTLRFCQVSDTAPEFRMLQACKYQLKPETIVVPSTSDASWFKMLSTPCLLVAGVGVGEDDENDAMGLAPARDSSADAGGGVLDGGDNFGFQDGGFGGEEDGGGSDGPRIVTQRNRDFGPAAAARRLSLLRTLTDLPDVEMSEREVLIYLEHVVPQEQEHARRAIAGLLAYLTRTGEDISGANLAVTALRRFSLESQLYMSPECFLSLGVFADDAHPSAHGGRAKEGFSLWSLFNRAKSKPGERTLKSWFARPTQDLVTLRERQGFIALLSDHDNDQLLPALHATVGKTKDVSKLEASLSRGGLLLSDFSNVLLTSSCAVKAIELLTAADVPKDLPAVARAHASIDPELYTVANTVASVVDFEASSSASRLCPGASKHISVRSGVHAELDAMREEYARIGTRARQAKPSQTRASTHACSLALPLPLPLPLPLSSPPHTPTPAPSRPHTTCAEPVLTRLAADERDRLDSLDLLPPGGALYIVYVPQLGFQLRLPMGGPGGGGSGEGGTFTEEERYGTQVAYDERAGLTFQFDAEDEWYFKGEACRQLDDEYGDISSRLKDIECELVRFLEKRLLQWLPMLTKAQLALAELDALLSLATCAREMHLTRPTLTESDAGTISIQGGWHPLVAALGVDGGRGRFGKQQPALVPNDCEIGSATERMMLLTGPNASGKTVYLRTVASN